MSIFDPKDPVKFNEFKKSRIKNIKISIAVMVYAVVMFNIILIRVLIELHKMQVRDSIFWLSILIAIVVNTSILSAIDAIWWKIRQLKHNKKATNWFELD